MKPIIPGIMLAVFLKESGQLTSRHVPVPSPGPGEVLVKIAAAPINPSDLIRIKNISDPSDKASFIPGIEGSGTVVAHGGGLLPRLWLGKRVACSSSRITSGTWAEYMVTAASDCIPLPAGISDEQGAMLLVNPLTAVSFFNIVKHDRHKAIINTAAASSLGRIIDLLGKKHHIPVIHVVRNDKQKLMLIDLGAEHVLNSSSSDFEESLMGLSQKLKATLALDAVGGKLTRQLMQAVPYGSSVVVYGNLSGESPEVDHRSLVLDNKKISGFYLVNSIKEGGMIRALRNIVIVRKLLKTDISLPVQNRFPLDKAGQAIDTYLGNMTGGKVLLMPE